MSADFSPSEAAFAGFRLMRERPRALMAWTALQAGFIAASYAVNSVVFASNAARFQEVIAINQVDPARALVEMGRMLPVLLPLLIVDAALFLFFSGVQNGAIYRAYLQPEDARRGYLRVGRAELSVAMAMVVYFVLGLGYLFAVLFTFDLALILSAGLSGPVSALLHIALVAALIGAIAYPSVRLSLGMPMSFDEKRVRILQSWRLTQGRFWPLLGAYLLTLVYVVLAGVVAAILFAAVAWIISRAFGGTGFDAWQAGEAPIAAQVLTLLINLPFQALLLAATFTVWRGPSASAYRAVKGAWANPGA